MITITRDGEGGFVIREGDGTLHFQPTLATAVQVAAWAGSRDSVSFEAGLLPGLYLLAVGVPALEEAMGNGR